MTAQKKSTAQNKCYGKLLTISEVEDILQVKRHTIYRYIKEKKLKGVKLASNTQWRIKDCDLAEFINTGTVED